ncbi:5-methylcytosine restriction system specificity protein McrC [Brevibacterium sp. K72]|uniref:5-methylcytosine restriction system specificity protein McrC n=1 Tax=Brevibacterium sp. K72 TaxID=3390729 RepID=UPI003D2FB56B
MFETTNEDVHVVDCVEYAQIDVDSAFWLGEDNRAIFNPEIDGKDVLRVNFSNGVLKLQATSFVGVIPINDRLVLRVRPRVPMKSLTRMVSETGHGVMALSALREYDGRGKADDWAMGHYTDSLLDFLDELIDAGLMRAYERREGEGHFPHGQLSTSRTIQHFLAKDVPNKAAFSWFERTVDIPANRCIKAAMEVIYDHLTRIKAQPRKGDKARLRRLAGHFAAFEGVALDADNRYLDDPLVAGYVPLPDSRVYYRPVLDLSKLIVRGIGIALDLGGNDVQMGSLLVDTNKLFENFVRISLANYARAHRWPVEVLDGNTEGKIDLYDIPDQPPSPLGYGMAAMASRNSGAAQPDVVLRSVGGEVPLIAEIKNTSTSDSTLPDRGHVEQAVTYAVRFGLDFALLIHPWNSGTKGLTYVGRVRSIDVYDYRLDMSSDELLDEALNDMSVTLARLAEI